jgi:hypothetical protein
MGPHPHPYGTPPFTDPDMLEVGVLHTPFSTDKGLTMAETRAHFGGWAIVSSPLTLSRIRTQWLDPRPHDERL